MSPTRKTYPRQRRRFWQKILDRFPAGHLTVGQFCQKEGISKAAFYAWRNKLALRSKPVGRRRRRTAAERQPSGPSRTKICAFRPRPTEAQRPSVRPSGPSSAGELSVAPRGRGPAQPPLVAGRGRSHAERGQERGRLRRAWGSGPRTPTAGRGFLPAFVELQTTATSAPSLELVLSAPPILRLSGRDFKEVLTVLQESGLC